MKIPSLADIQHHCARAEAAPNPKTKAMWQAVGAAALAQKLANDLGLERAIALSSPADPGGLHEALLALREGGAA